uniref:Abscisic acid 8'-hydroxylase 2-like n=1 Tax=Rhizophora mucronata TaxID=61149 RepID=A0A2P2KUT8_RHIMU
MQVMKLEPVFSSPPPPSPPPPFAFANSPALHYYHSQAVFLMVPAVVFCSFSLLLLLLLAVVFLFHQWHQRKVKRNRLPPGSMGWPYIGETLKLYTENPNSFFSSRQKRYGNIFKTHILGCPCVMISSPEAARIVLVTMAHLFKPTYPPSKEKMIGPDALFFHQGAYHSRLKKLVQASFLPSAIRGSVYEIEQVVLNFLPTWKDATINTLQEMKRYALDVAMISAFGEKEGLEMEREVIKHLYRSLEKGYNSMPLDLPGTPFHKAMKVRSSIYIHLFDPSFIVPCLLGCFGATFFCLELWTFVLYCFSYVNCIWYLFEFKGKETT